MPSSRSTMIHCQHVLRVERRQLRWEVSLDGKTRPMIDWLCTRDRAVEHALEIADRLLASPGRESVLLVISGAEHVLSNQLSGAPAAPTARVRAWPR